MTRSALWLLLGVAGLGFAQDNDPPVKTRENDPYQKLNPENQIVDINRQAAEAKNRHKQWQADFLLKKIDMSAGKEESVKGRIVVKNVKGTWKMLWTQEGIKDREQETKTAISLEGRKLLITWPELKQYRKIDVGKPEDFHAAQLFFPCYDPSALAPYFDIKLMSAATEWQKKLDLTKRDKAPENKEFDEKLKQFEKQAQEQQQASGQIDTNVHHCIELHPKDARLKEQFHLARVYVHMETLLISQVEFVETADMLKKTELRLMGTTFQGEIDDKSLKLSVAGFTVKPKPKKK